MGTETLIKELAIDILYQQVKLNNPLMGTETVHLFLFKSLPIDNNVKLNNPLMGTETFIHTSDNSSHDFIKLN